MKKRVIWMIALLCMVAQGTWAEDEPTTNPVTTEQELTNAIANDASNIQLGADIVLSKYLDINNKTVTIDLNGHSLSRNLSANNSAGHVIWVHNGSTLTLTSTATTEGDNIKYGIIENGKANNGGAIHIPFGNTVTATNVTFQNNSAADHAGAIWNNGTLTAINCTFTNNTANDVGAIYNSVTTSGAGTATLTNCTFTGNVGTNGAGALANALGATTMTIDGCTIQNNTAGSNGGGIWNGGTLNMKGKVTVTGNQRASLVASNVYLKSGKVITVNGSLDGSTIGVELEDILGTFTSGWGGNIPENVFTADYGNLVNIHIDTDNEEAYLYATEFAALYYIERSWDDTNKQLVSTLKSLTGSPIAYDANPTTEGEYKQVTNAPANNLDEWFGMGGYSTTVPEYYVVQGKVKRETIVVQGTDVHLILCDNSTLTLTGGLKLEGNNKLYIHSQSYSGNMGQLIVSNKYESAAGIGSAWDKVDGATVGKTVGQLVIYGGHIEATGGEYGAGIGSCQRRPTKIAFLCSSVTVYGGYVKATGGKNAAGIGGGAGYDEWGILGGTFTLYDGTVIAQGGETAAGVGGGGNYSSWTYSKDGTGGGGGIVNIYGGELTATGGKNGAGIGSGKYGLDNRFTALGAVGGEVNIYNGKVTANGGTGAAGIGTGSYCSNGAKVCIYNGTVIANGGEHGAGIGGGDEGTSGTFKIFDGTVIANGGTGAAGIGGGYKGDCSQNQDNVNIAGGTVIAMGGGDNRAFGPGKDSHATNNGPLKLGNNMMVGAGNNGAVQKYFTANERKNACWGYSYAEVSPCTHDGCTYTATENQHTRHCNYCAATKAEDHTYKDSKCVVCNYETNNTYNLIFCLPDLEDDNKLYREEKYPMGPGSTIILPICEIIPNGYEFVGWVENSNYYFTSYLQQSGETLLEPLSEYTINPDNVTLTARFREVNVTLYNDQFNGETLFAYDEKTAKTVTLEGRTLYKDGKWNTLCLPFSLTEEQLASSPIAGGDIRTLSSAEFSKGTLTLNFTEQDDVESITAGTPYIVKWATTGNPIYSPTFNNVTINYTYNPVETNAVTFNGNFSPVGVAEGGDKSILFVGDDDTLYYPSQAMVIGAFRAYFQLNGIEAGDSTDPQSENVRQFVLNFGDGEQTGIAEAEANNTRFTLHTSPNDSWFTLDGRRLNGKPAAKGLYINNNKKIFINISH